MPTPSAEGAALAPAGRRPDAGAVLRLVRWPNALIASAGVLLGAAWAGAVRPATWLATIAAFALTAVANTVNDLHDVAIDRLAHPDRPLPSGTLSRDAARTVAAASAIVGVVASAIASPALGALSAVVVASMVWYSVALKSRRGVAGNVLVALLASLPFLYGAWTAGRPARGLFLVGIAVPLHFAREVAKDLDDAAADAPTRRTLPVVAGARVARVTVLASCALFAVVATAFFARRGLPALALALASAVCAAAAARRVLLAGVGAPTLLKGSMLLAMAALAAESVLPPS